MAWVCWNCVGNEIQKPIFNKKQEYLTCVLTHIYLNAHSLVLSPMGVVCYVLYFATKTYLLLSRSLQAKDDI